MTSPRLRFGLAFVLLARRWRRTLDRHLADLGLTDATWVPLVHLEEAGEPISQTELAARVGVEGSSLVRLIDILVGRGLILRTVDPLDRRTRRISLTAAGRDSLRDIRRILAEAEAEMLADVGDAEVAGALDLFARIDRRLRLMAETPR
ncbi:MarR family transcriptional regulator [Roseomonas sp. HJA6]|uniref:MarR family transcriptional regulator n=1 Tax=Roseomonas alba TaxID=2846776 RepID=A0ABS7AFE5_9PROT|nr:MarR family transcriptional regulator [Neoroseomonas alba]MBW6400785.1 MarR family transcriptional regulator [Neoroseomonas alba]